MPLIELSALLIVLVACLVLPRMPASGARRLVRWWTQLSARQGWCVVGIGSLALAIQAAIGCLVQLPQPALHDEFSYLLAADTFAHGRLTNPTHPLWEHFESYNIIHVPTYQSKYPPGQGLALALGQLLCGLPACGAWLTVAAACAAATWMAYAWLPPRWALVAGLLTVSNFRLLRFWGHTYMGAGLTLLGGALLFGALRRVIRYQRPIDALLLACGVAILAWTRPYEGLIASLCAAAALLAWLASANRPDWSVLLRRVVLPAALVVLPLTGGIALYNQQVTGHWLKLPYQAWLETYGVQDSLLSLVVRGDLRDQQAHAPQRRVGSEPTQADWQLWEQQRGSASRKLGRQWAFYVGLTLTPVLLVVPQFARRDWMLFALLTCSAVLVAILLQDTHGHAQYAAPVGGLIYVLLAQGLRGLSTSFRGPRRIGRRLALALPALVVAMLAVYVFGQWLPSPVPDGMEWSLRRAELAEQLARDGQRHVVIVRYPPADVTGIHWQEWVYNGASIDDAPVVWAHDLGLNKNQALTDYFADRHVWLLDLQSQKLRRYERSLLTGD
ncbi:MAG: hypothetical protein J5I93_09240 [Pirellulaceae bacterium]|nr:hypothetical protein [Pirellulaceae bacterium]